MPITVRYIYTHQVRAVCKRVAVDSLNTPRNNHACQTDATPKRMLFYMGYAIRDLQFSHQLAVVMQIRFAIKKRVPLSMNRTPCSDIRNAYIGNIFTSSKRMPCNSIQARREGNAFQANTNAKRPKTDFRHAIGDIQLGDSFAFQERLVSTATSVRPSLVSNSPSTDL